MLSGALEEKSNRVVEVLVSTARPWQLLTGKVLATSVLSGPQIVLMVGVALGVNAAVGVFELPAATGAILVVSAIMLVAGFLFYAALFTVAGTLAVTMEDAQSTAGPLPMVLTLLGAIVTVRLAGRIYAASLLSGGRLTWRAAWRAEPVR